MKAKPTSDGCLLFWCPGCEEPHQVQVEGPHAWDYNRDVDAPTLNPSVLVTGFNALSMPRTCHSFVTDGRIQYLGDSTHSKAGQTVDLPEWED